MISPRFTETGAGLAEVFLRNYWLPFLAEEVEWQPSCVKARGYFPKVRYELDDSDRAVRVLEPRPLETVAFPLSRIEKVRDPE